MSSQTFDEATEIRRDHINEYRIEVGVLVNILDEPQKEDIECGEWEGVVEHIGEEGEVIDIDEDDGYVELQLKYEGAKWFPATCLVPIGYEPPDPKLRISLLAEIRNERK